jgi:hypothetical protein
VVESLMGTFFGPSWSLAVSFGILLIALAVRPAGTVRALDAAVSEWLWSWRSPSWWAGSSSPRCGLNPYLYFAGYVILQYIVIATAWNILGGYAGYVNFGTPALLRARRVHRRLPHPYGAAARCRS